MFLQLFLCKKKCGFKQFKFDPMPTIQATVMLLLNQRLKNPPSATVKNNIFFLAFLGGFYTFSFYQRADSAEIREERGATFSLLCFIRMRVASQHVVLFIFCLLTFLLIHFWQPMLFWPSVRVKRAKLLLCWSESDVSWSCPVTRVPITVSKSSMKGLTWVCSSELYLYTCAQTKRLYSQTIDILVIVLRA